MAKGKGVGQGLGQKDGTRVKGQWGGVGPWVKGEARAWDISIVKYNGFCCLQKFNLFPKIEYHSLFSDLFIFYIFSENA